MNFALRTCLSVGCPSFPASSCVIDAACVCLSVCSVHNVDTYLDHDAAKRVAIGNE